MNYFPESISSIFQLTHDLEEFPGVIHRMIDHGIAGTEFDLRSKQEVGVQEACFKLGNITEQQFLTSLLKCLYLSPASVSKDFREILEMLSPPMRKLSIDKGKRFCFNLERFVPISIKVETHLDAMRSNFFSKIGARNNLSPNQIMLNFLTLADKHRLSSVSKDLNRLCSTQQYSLIHSFLAALQREINRKSYCDRRSSNLSTGQKLFSLNYLIASAIFILSLLYLVNTPEDERKPGLHAATMLGVVLSSIDLILSCFPILGYCLQDFLNCTLTVCEIPIAICQGLFAGKERFDNVTIADFSLELQIKYQQLIKEYRIYPGFSLHENSSIAEIRRQFSDLEANFRPTNTSPTLSLA